LHKKWKRSAKGAEYESQGQARSEAQRVAPGKRKQSGPALKARNTRDISAFQALSNRAYRTRGDVPRFARHLPLAFIFRAFGAPFRLFVQSHFCSIIVTGSNTKFVYLN
jgi:hypothetical protein